MRVMAGASHTHVADKGESSSYRTSSQDESPSRSPTSRVPRHPSQRTERFGRRQWPDRASLLSRPSLDSASWLLRGIPKPIARALRVHTARALAEPETLGPYAELGLDIVGSKPDQFAQTIDAERVKRAKMIKVAGIRLESGPASDSRPGRIAMIRRGSEAQNSGTHGSHRHGGYSGWRRR